LSGAEKQSFLGCLLKLAQKKTVPHFNALHLANSVVSLPVKTLREMDKKKRNYVLP
jgi:hypothetical protein